MGLGEFLSGQTKILTYEIVFDRASSLVGINTIQCASELNNAEYIRMWACHCARLMHIFDSKSISKLMLLGILTSISSRGIKSKTNCFESGDIEDVVKYSEKVTFSGTKYKGNYYGRGTNERHVNLSLPFSGTEQQGVFGNIALLQFAQRVNRKDKANLLLLELTIKNLLSLYGSGMGGVINAMMLIPNKAYSDAVQSIVANPPLSIAVD